MTYLKDKIPPPINSDCVERVRYPSTSKLLVLLGSDRESLKEMDDYIARNLMDTSLGLHCLLREGQDWLDYKVNLEICIGRLNLRWD